MALERIGPGINFWMDNQQIFYRAHSGSSQVLLKNSDYAWNIFGGWKVGDTAEFGDNAQDGPTPRPADRTKNLCVVSKKRGASDEALNTV